MDGRTPETCEECGFDARMWRVRDAVSVLGETGEWWRMATADIAAKHLNARPAPGVWSALEYGLHTSLVLAVVRAGLQAVLASDGVALPAVPESSDATAGDAVIELDPTAVLEDLEHEGLVLAALGAGTAREVWSNVGHLPDGSVIQAQAALVHAAHDASHHFMDVGRGLATIGVGAPAQVGSVHRVNASDGGVPKRSIGGADVDHAGLVGDRQADHKHHGRPFQALCLWSSDVIGKLAADGHPIEAGSAGENVTIEGVDWAALRPGARLRMGTVLAEVSFPATPCAKQTRWFADSDFNRIDYGRNPQWVRWYAWVREPGRLDEGDRVIVQP